MQGLGALAAVNFEMFYATRQPPSGQAHDLLVLQLDGKGIVDASDGRVEGRRPELLEDGLEEFDRQNRCLRVSIAEDEGASGRRTLRAHPRQQDHQGRSRRSERTAQLVSGWFFESLVLWVLRRAGCVTDRCACRVASRHALCQGSRRASRDASRHSSLSSSVSVRARPAARFFLERAFLCSAFFRQ